MNSFLRVVAVAVSVLALLASLEWILVAIYFQLAALTLLALASVNRN